MANTILERIGTEHELDISIVRDSTVAAIMSDVDFVLIGAEGVVESGGIINTVRRLACLFGRRRLPACVLLVSRLVVFVVI